MRTVFFVGPKMIYCRKKAGLKVAEMAELLELDKDDYYAWEMSKCDPPLNIIFKIARCFNVPLEDLLDDEMDIVVFEIKYDYFHFAEFREKRELFEKYNEKNQIEKKLYIDDFFRKRKFQLVEKK
ncbi:MAG: helix-turn-helix domain-containing protein [Eubacterium sp.]|nr:helix-turn-helix domain-containing protein [Eubacterium sp.]